MDEAIRLWQPDPSSASGYRERVLHQDAPLKEQLAHLLKYAPDLGWDHAVAFSPRGDALAAAAFDGGVRLWRGAERSGGRL